MPVYAGPFWRDGEPREGHVRIEGTRVVDEGSGAPSGARPAVIIDGLHNYHTHVGDAFLRGRPLPRSLPALVKPGTGYKHRMLSQARPALLESGVRRALKEYSQAGTRSLLDFREQGVPGLGWVRRVHKATGAEAPILRLLGRPMRSPLSESELEALLDRGDGIGVSSLTDVGPEPYADIAKACHRGRRALVVHVSEQRREDMEAVLEGRPALLVHAVAASTKDLRRVHDADVPVAVCPSSNQYFGLKTPVRALRRADVRFFLGTDNAMLGGFDLLREARLVKRRCPECRDEELLRALTTPPEKAINHVTKLPPESGTRESIAVLPLRRGRVQWNARPLVARR